MSTQDSLKYYIARTSSGATVVKLLSRLNTRTGKAKVFVIKVGILEIPDNTVVNNFQLIHGVLKFVLRDNEVRFSNKTKIPC